MKFFPPYLTYCKCIFFRLNRNWNFVNINWTSFQVLLFVFSIYSFARYNWKDTLKFGFCYALVLFYAKYVSFLHKNYYKPSGGKIISSVGRMCGSFWDYHMSEPQFWNYGNIFHFLKIVTAAIISPEFDSIGLIRYQNVN